MPNTENKRYTARICWNRNKWRCPSGDASRLEKGSYVAESGFGHEEWLFNFTWLIGGFHYAFLPPVHKSFEKMTGSTIDVYLYTIDGDGERLYAGLISNCEVLLASQAEEALKVYRERHWLDGMAEDVRKVEGNVDALLDESRPTYLFNIRFRLEDADPFDPLRPADRSDAVWKRNRYALAAADEEVTEHWRTRKGQTTPPMIWTVTRKGVPTLTYDPNHKRIQADLLPMLEKQYGAGNVVLERDFVDIRVADGKKTILIEIKTASNARSAIREAIGQLLEYAYYRAQTWGGEVGLVVIAPGKLDKPMTQYIQRLRNEFNIPISYYSHSEGEPLPESFFGNG